MRRIGTPRRAGFTLLELITVIAIIGVLAALTATAVVQVLATQKAGNTEKSVIKIQNALDGQWKAVLDQCGSDRRDGRIPPAIVAYCGGDPDAAAALWTLLNLRKEFPENFTEAQSDVLIPNVYNLPRRQTFKSASGATTDEGAVLLFLILDEKSNRGMSFSAGDTGGGGQLGTDKAGFRVFKDANATPITFRRFFGANAKFGGSPPPTYSSVSELQNAPFLNKNGSSIDPLDPTGKLLNVLSTADPANPGWSKRQVVEKAVGTQIGPNKRITAIAYGQDGKLNVNGAGDIDPTGVSDDVFGYRVVRLGNRGD